MNPEPTDLEWRDMLAAFLNLLVSWLVFDHLSLFLSALSYFVGGVLHVIWMYRR